MKSLEELCLTLISRNISDFSSRLGPHLSTKHKEMILERLSWHGLFSQQLLPIISYQLFSSSLQRITLTDSEQINDSTLELLGVSRCQPVSFTLHKCPLVTNKGIQLLSKLSFFIKMEYLKLSKLKGLQGSEGFQRVGSKSVKQLVLTGCSGLRDNGLIDIVKRCTSVYQLDLSENHKLTDESIINVSETLGGNLREISCNEISNLTNASTIALATYCHCIVKANFEGCVKLDGSGLIQMAESCLLEELNISFCYKLQPLTVDTLVSTLNAKGPLRSIDLMAISFGDFTVEFISSCHLMSHLFIAGVSINDNEFDTLCRSLGSTLKQLDISGCPLLTDSSCTSIAQHLQKIEFVGMRNMKDISGSSLTELFQNQSRADNIKYVAFSGSKNINVQVIESIARNCHNIETLLLAGLRGITDDIAFLLADNCPQLTYCSLRNCLLTDIGVSRLAVHCKKLVMLALAGIHQLTDLSIHALANNCPYLNEIHLSGCALITKQALTFLSDTVICSLWINHNVPNAPPGLLMAKDLDTGKYQRVDN